MAGKLVNKMMAMMSRHMMACDEAGYLISKSFDEKIGFRKKVSLKIHLMSCRLCRNYQKQLSQLNEYVGTYREQCESQECMHQLSDSQIKCINDALSDAHKND